MQVITSGDLFRAALRKCGGIIAEGETPSADLMEDTRLAFNVMIDSWSVEPLSVFTTEDQTFTWPAGYASRTLGPTGDLVGLRPVGIDDSTYFRDPVAGLSYPLEVIQQADYDAIALKTATSTYPQFITVGSDVPNATVYVYPIPTSNLEFHFISMAELTQVTDLFVNIIAPPGYIRAFIFNLAAEMCPELGIEPPVTTKRMAILSRRIIRNNNSAKNILQMPSGLLKTPGFNILTGE
jgi:hypothetical protein